MNDTDQPFTVRDLIMALNAIPLDAPVYRDDSQFRAVPLCGVVETIAESHNFFTGTVMPSGVRIR